MWILEVKGYYLCSPQVEYGFKGIHLKRGGKSQNVSSRKKKSHPGVGNLKTLKFLWNRKTPNWCFFDSTEDTRKYFVGHPLETGGRNSLHGSPDSDLVDPP